MSTETPSNYDRILSAAQGLFLAKGFNGSNLRDIAREAKVSMGGIYHYFGSKEEIYRSLLESVDVAADMVGLVNLLRAPEFPQNLAEVGTAVAEVIRKHRDTFKLMYVDVLEFQGSHVRPMVTQFYENFGQLSGALLAEREGELIDAHPALIMRVLAAVFVHTRLEEVMLEQPLAEVLGVDEDEMNRQMAMVLLNGILKR